MEPSNQDQRNKFWTFSENERKTKTQTKTCICEQTLQMGNPLNVKCCIGKMVRGKSADDRMLQMIGTVLSDETKRVHSERWSGSSHKEG